MLQLSLFIPGMEGWPTFENQIIYNTIATDEEKKTI